jgi:hypothetical protein
VVQARVRIRWDRLAGSEIAPWLLCAVFVVGCLTVIGRLDYNYDEGVYIQQALLIQSGKLPFRDFFYHQTPLYPFTLAAAGIVAPHSLLPYRAFSVLVTGLAGFFVYRIAIRFVPRRWGLVAMLFFYAVPLQFYGLLAAPVGVMEFCVIAGIPLVYFSWRRTPIAVGTVLCCLSVLYKPLSVAACLALGIALLVTREQRRKVPWVALVVIVFGAVAFASFHVMTDGAFTKMVALQGSRYATKQGFEQMMSFEPFRKIAEANEVETPLAWNLNEHRRTFFVMPYVNGNFWLMALTIAGLAIVWGPRGRRWRGRRLLVTLWLGMAVLFTIVLWEPIWDHYCIQYLPPMAVFATIFLHSMWTRPDAGRGTHVAVVAVIVVTAALGAVGIVSRQQVSTDLLARPAAPGEPWLTFDPFMNFVTGTVPACGIIDPLNTYGERSLLGMAHVPELARYYVGPEDVMRCLEADPHARVAYGMWAAWFVDPELRKYIEHLPKDRLVLPMPPMPSTPSS